MTTVAGTGSAGFSGDGGSALDGSVQQPVGYRDRSTGALYIADLDNNRVRRLTAAHRHDHRAAAVGRRRQCGEPSTRSRRAGNAARFAGNRPHCGRLTECPGFFSNRSGESFPAQIFSIDSTKVALVVPTAIAASQTVQMQILNNGNLLAQIPSAVADAAPALFADLSGQAMAVNQDGTFNSSTNPASLGSVLSIYGTGQGVAGFAVSAAIGGYAAQVLYAGPVVGYPGLLQVNVQMPSGYIATGRIEHGGLNRTISSQPGVFIMLN